MFYDISQYSSEVTLDIPRPSRDSSRIIPESKWLINLNILIRCFTECDFRICHDPRADSSSSQNVEKLFYLKIILMF
jgi:hypothetical protein